MYLSRNEENLIRLFSLIEMEDRQQWIVRGNYENNIFEIVEVLTDWIIFTLIDYFTFVNNQQTSLTAHKYAALQTNIKFGVLLWCLV